MFSFCAGNDIVLSGSIIIKTAYDSIETAASMFIS